MAEGAPREPAAEAVRSPARRRRWPRRLAIFLVASPFLLVALVAAILTFLPAIVTKDRVRDEAVSALTELLGTCVSIERVEYHPFSGIQLFGVKVCPPPGFDRDVFTAKRIAARYDLSDLTSKVVRVREVAIDAPHVVVETKHGQRNVDALQAHLAKGKPPEEKRPSEPLRGPLSPITLILEKAAISGVALELVGEGPNASLSGLSVTMDAFVDPRELRAGLKVELAPPGGPDADDVIAKVPATADQPAASVAMGLGLTMTASVAADVYDGLQLKVAELHARLRARADVERGATKLPRTTLEAGLGLAVRPGEDRAELSSLTASLNGRSIAGARASIDGLAALFDAALGKAAAAALAGDLGVRRGKGEGLVDVSVDELALPLDVLAPYAAVFKPGMSVGGKIALGPIHLLGTAPEIEAGEPRRFDLKLAFDHVRVADPSVPFSLGDLHGALSAARAHDAPAPFMVDGTLTFDRIAQASNRVGGAELGLRGELQRLAWPLPGRSRFDVTFGAHDVVSPKARVGKATFGASIEGQDVYAESRGAAPPVEVGLTMAIDHVESGTGTAAIALSGLSMEAKTLLDHVLVPALRPITSKVELGVKQVALADGTKVAGTKLGMTASVNDPRTGAPLDATADLQLGVERVGSAQADLEQVSVKLGVKADQVAPRYMAGEPRTAPPKMLPASVVGSLDVVLPKVVAKSPAFGAWTTNARLSTSARADLVQGTARVDAAALELAKLVRVRSTVDVRRFLAPDRDLDLKMEVEPIDLAALIAAVPKELYAKAPGVPSSGTVGLSVKVKGRQPLPGAKLDLSAPPLDADVALRFADIDLALPEKQLDVKGFGGSIKVGVKKGRTAVETALQVARIEGGPKERLEPIEGLVLTSTASLRGDVWALVVEADQARAPDPSRRNDTRISIDVAYPKHGDVDVRRFDVKVPRMGVDLAMSGGLSRRAFGVLRPELSVRAALDLDRLRTLAPELGDAHGGVAFALDVQSKQDTALDVRGQLELDHLSYAKPGLAEVKNATGRIPIEQRLQLPAPALRELGVTGEGQLGDDLEARIAELQGDVMAAKVYLDSDDILVEAPRAADYQPLRPYLADTGARLTIEQLVYGPNVLKNVSLEALWKTGVFRVDRFAAQLWEGDILADIAFQITADQNARMRMRATITDLNMDIPYAAAKGIPVVTDPARKEPYRISGTMDLKFALRERSLNGTIDLTKLQKPTLERMLGMLDPKGTNENMQRSAFALDISEDMGLRPISGKFWITQNILGMSIDWQRLPVHFKFRSPGDYFSSALAPLGFFKDVTFFFARPVLMVTVGSFIVNTVNGALDKVSAGNFLEPILAKMKLEALFDEKLGGKVIAEEKAGTGGAQAAE